MTSIRESAIKAVIEEEKNKNLQEEYILGLKLEKLLGTNNGGFKYQYENYKPYIILEDIKFIVTQEKVYHSLNNSKDYYLEAILYCPSHNRDYGSFNKIKSLADIGKQLMRYQKCYFCEAEEKKITTEELFKL